MDLSGERRLPAARHVVWHALSDEATLAESLPPGWQFTPRGDGTFEIGMGEWRTLAALDGGNGAAQSVLHLTAPEGAAHGFGGRADATMVEDGVFTRMLWRFASDLPDAERARVEDAVEHLFSHIGQRSATPEPIAAQGAAGVAAAIATAAAPVVRDENSPLRVILRTLAAMPRESTIGGAVFTLVVFFVVGIL